MAEEMGSGSLYWAPQKNTTTKTPYIPPNPNAGKILGADGVWRTPEDNHNYVYGLGPYAKGPAETPTGAEFSGAFSMPEYNPQPYNVNLPTIDWNWKPTEEQRGLWKNQASDIAAQEIDPQLAAIAAALAKFKSGAETQRGEINPRYTTESLNTANIAKNSKQDVADLAVRRGAETSGWLPEQVGNIGATEIATRNSIENARNQELAALAALVSGQETAAGEQNVNLEGLRGKRINTAMMDLENTGWNRDLSTKQNTWNSALGGEQLRASAYGANAANELAAYQTQAAAAQAQAQLELEAAVAAANQSNNEWQQNYTTSTDAYQRQLAAAKAATGGVRKNPITTINGFPIYNLDDLATAYKTYGMGAYKQQDQWVSGMDADGRTYMYNTNTREVRYI